jgi:hypothetical protein
LHPSSLRRGRTGRLWIKALRPRLGLRTDRLEEITSKRLALHLLSVTEALD